MKLQLNRLLFNNNFIGCATKISFKHEYGRKKKAKTTYTVN